MNDDRFFNGLEPPAPPPGLREAALRAGRAAFAEAPRADVWTRLVRSPAARLAWAASVAALLGAHAYFPSHPRPEAPSGLAPATEGEVGVIARLPRIDDRVLPVREGDRS